jgi:serine/threonine-protein kinase
LSVPARSFSFGPYVLEQSQWRLRQGEEVIPLPPKALSLLILLVEHAGSMVTKGEILAKVWDGAFVEEGNVAFYVAMLRKALDDPPDVPYIETIRTRGYRFVAPVAVLAGPAHDSPTASASVEITPGPHVPAPSVAKEVADLVGVPRARTLRFWSLAAVAAVIGALALAWVVEHRRTSTVRSVVVVPFRAIAPAGDQAYLESGIANAIAMRLGGLETLRVPPLAAIRSGEGPFEAGRRLETDAVLTGTIQRTDTRLLVTAEVYRVADQTRLGSWTFDTTPGEILNVQNQIAEQIAVRFTRDLSDVEHAQLLRRDTASADAYDLFLRARERWSRRTPATVRQAIALYDQAIALDPKFVRAYAGLANCYNLAWSGIPARVRYPLAKLNAEKAIALDPESAEAHTSVAFMRYKFEWRWKDAEAEFQKAIALDPRDALARHWHGEFLTLMARTSEGVDELKRALELDPSSLAIRADLSTALLWGGRLDEAVATLESGRAIDPNWAVYPAKMSEILSLRHRDRESAESLWRAKSLNGVPLRDIDELRAAFEKGGQPAMIRAEIAQYMRLHPESDTPDAYFAATNLSLAYGRLGERDEAFRWLGIAIDRHEDAPIHLMSNPAYASLRGDPRYAELVKRVGLR